MTNKKKEKNCNTQVGNTGNTQKDEKFYGIQAFINAKDAWYVMTDSWGYNCDMTAAGAPPSAGAARGHRLDGS